MRRRVVWSPPPRPRPPRHTRRDRAQTLVRLWHQTYRGPAEEVARWRPAAAAAGGQAPGRGQRRRRDPPPRAARPARRLSLCRPRRRPDGVGRRVARPPRRDVAAEGRRGRLGRAARPSGLGRRDRHQSDRPRRPPRPGRRGFRRRNVRGGPAPDRRRPARPEGPRGRHRARRGLPAARGARWKAVDARSASRPLELAPNRRWSRTTATSRRRRHATAPTRPARPCGSRSTAPLPTVPMP